MAFGLMRRYCSEHATHAKRLIAKLGAQPIVARAQRRSNPH